jgi:hypothetical protein
MRKLHILIQYKISSILICTIFCVLNGHAQLVKIDTLSTEHHTLRFDPIFNEYVLDVYYAESSGYRYILDSNSNCIFEGSFVDFLEHGTWIEYYSSGKIKSISNYTYGSQIGLYIEYWENGNLKESGLMDIQNPNDSAFIKDLVTEKVTSPTIDGSGSVVTAFPKKSSKSGVWFYFSETGGILPKEFWVDGKKR